MRGGCYWLQTCETVWVSSPTLPTLSSPDSLSTLLVRRKFPFPVSRTQTLDAGKAAGGGDFQLPPLSALNPWTSHLTSLGPFLLIGQNRTSK